MGYGVEIGGVPVGHSILRPSGVPVYSSLMDRVPSQALGLFVVPEGIGRAIWLLLDAGGNPVHWQGSHCTITARHIGIYNPFFSIDRGHRQLLNQ